MKVETANECRDLQALHVNFVGHLAILRSMPSAYAKVRPTRDDTIGVSETDQENGGNS